MGDQSDEDTRRIVAHYDPTQEFVVVLLKSGYRISTYRVLARPSIVEDLAYISQGTDRLRQPNIEPPDVETLIEWETEGGCEAACPQHCWVQPHSTCPHGNPSWLLKLGLI